MNIEVHKFGGASIQDAKHIRTVGSIIREHIPEQSVIVVSAMGKMTNALELVANAIFNKEDYRQRLEEVKSFHVAIVHELFEEPSHIEDALNDILIEVEWIANEENSNYDYVYDQIVSIGELMSSLLVSNYLNVILGGVNLIDARDWLATDQTFRTAKVDWDATRSKIERNIQKQLGQSKYVLTQGFIGCDIENNTTTLGREGSDYSAAILGHALQAQSVTVWKDVPGILTSDPKLYPNAELISELSYIDLYTMADYGAKVIHPKTILPLESKGIPLHVRSFLNPDLSGTIISKESETTKQTLITIKEDQSLVTLTPKIFDKLPTPSEVLNLLEQQNLEINFFRKHAISYGFCCKNDMRLHLALKTFEEAFEIQVQENLQLLTMLQGEDQLLEELINQRKVIFTIKETQTTRVIVEA